MELKSLLAKLRNRFQVSAAETDDQDLHQILVICVAAVAANSAQADSICDHIIDFIASNTEAELLEVHRVFY